MMTPAQLCIYVHSKKFSNFNSIYARLIKTNTVINSNITYIFSTKYNKVCFFTLSDNLFALNQHESFFSSQLITSISVAMSSPLKSSVVSSAKMIKWIIWEQLTISLMYNRNSNGPRIEPWGTPQVTVFHDESTPLRLTYCMRLLK